jgi:hypothetical protein
MRKYLLVLGLLSNLFVNAQSNEDAKAEAAPGVVDGEPFTVSSTYSNKNLFIAKQSTGNNRYALLDYTSRKKITPFVFEFITRIGNDDKFQVLVNTRYGVINTTGQWTIPCIYDEMNIITIHGVAYYIVSKNSRYGMINGQNEVIVPFEYEEISKSHYAAMDVVVRRNGKMGVLNFIDHKMIVPVIYDRVYVMSSKLIRVGNGPLNSLLNINGQKISDWYTELERIPNAFAQEFFIAAKDGKYGIVSAKPALLSLQPPRG